MPSIVTKTGDKGTTGLVGGDRVSKDDVRLRAVGAVDELNAFLGLALAEDVEQSPKEKLIRTQHVLFHAGADLATPVPLKSKRIERAHIEEIEAWIEALEPSLPPLDHFILPGGAGPGALIHVARTVCRRAERETVALASVEAVNPHVQVYLNRLGDFLFLLARSVNMNAGVPEIAVEYD
jgi:cob(I)alamin adenosyltransferase